MTGWTMGHQGVIAMDRLSYALTAPPGLGMARTAPAPWPHAGMPPFAPGCGAVPA